MPSHKRVKVINVQLTVEEEDGRRFLRTLEGDDAEHWGRVCDSAMMLAFVHGQLNAVGPFPWHQRPLPTPQASVALDWSQLVAVFNDNPDAIKTWVEQSLLPILRSVAQRHVREET